MEHKHHTSSYKKTLSGFCFQYYYTSNIRNEIQYLIELIILKCIVMSCVCVIKCQFCMWWCWVDIRHFKYMTKKITKRIGNYCRTVCKIRPLYCIIYTTARAQNQWPSDQTSVPGPKPTFFLWETPEMSVSWTIFDFKLIKRILCYKNCKMVSRIEI